VWTQTQATAVTYAGGEFALNTDKGELRADNVFIATRRSPNTEGL
jgi:mercuric reductase